MRWFVVIVLAGLVASTWGLPAGAQENGDLRIEDEAGDAYEWNTDWMADATPCPRHEIPEAPSLAIGRTCRRVMQWARW